MSLLREMSYDEFGKLRFLDFFQKTDRYSEDHDGGLETGIGLACTEGYLDTMFTSPVDMAWSTVEILLGLGSDCPLSEGHALLDALGLKLRKGMTAPEIKELLGSPETDDADECAWPIKKGDPRWIDSTNLKALVSEMCFAEGEHVRFLYREAADRKEDSGWRMFTGHETQEYNDDRKNVRIVQVGYMLDRDPSLLQPLKEGIGAVFERRTKDEPWNKVTDWNPGQ